DLARIPATGPLVVVANHPLGGLDGLALCALLRRVRPDVKLLGNHFLRSIPDLAVNLIYVDPFAGADAAACTPAAVRAALRWLRGGGVLVLLPPGEVAHVVLPRLDVADPPGSATTGRLILSAGCPVVTAHFDGRNSRLFQAMGLIHPRLRTAMLP